MGEINKILRWY